MIFGKLSINPTSRGAPLQDQQRHIHTRWLLERALSDDKDKSILWEDIAAGANSKAHDILKRFLTTRPLLPHDKRNLYQYGNLADVTEVIRPLEGVKTPGDLKAEERERVDKETVVLYEKDGYKVLVPMSEEASCYWGRGTEWCTAATKSENAFQRYHQKGPLVICILPDGKKVQFHKNSKPVDENDAKLKDVTDPFLVQLCSYYNRLGSISETLRDRDICLEAVKQYGFSLCFVPKELRDREMCLMAVKNDGWALGDVSEELRDREMCLEAVKNHGNALRFVPKELIDNEMCLMAVKNDGWALQYVPHALRDREMYLTAVKHNKDELQYVPEELRDRVMCLEAVKKSGRDLFFVPSALCDREMCLKAVKQNGQALVDVPHALRDREMCLETVKRDGLALEYVPNALRDREICLIAVNNHRFALGDVPHALKDEINEDLRGHSVPKHYETVTPPEWIESSLLLEMKSYLQEKLLEIKSCSFSSLHPKM